MRQIASRALDDYLPGMKVVGQRLYLANKGSFRVFDISDPPVPSEVAAVPVPERAQELEIVDYTAYVSTYRIDEDRSRQGLVVIDVHDPRAPRRLGWLELTSPLRLSFLETDVSAAGRFVYLWGSQVVDAREPSRQRPASPPPILGGPLAAAIASNPF